jgi:hypothetical protein
VVEGGRRGLCGGRGSGRQSGGGRGEQRLEFGLYGAYVHGLNALLHAQVVMFDGEGCMDGRPSTFHLCRAALALEKSGHVHVGSIKENTRENEKQKK